MRKRQKKELTYLLPQLLTYHHPQLRRGLALCAKNYLTQDKQKHLLVSRRKKRIIPSFFFPLTFTGKLTKLCPSLFSVEFGTVKM